MNQLTILPNATPEQQEAAAMHFEIVQAAKHAVDSLLDLSRKLKRMRDSGRYKELGFATFGEYTEAAVGIKQRQAYNYISVVESLPARLIEENSAAGVTKLALLAKLNPEDREEMTGEALANISVADLKKLVEERDAMAQQLSMFQETQQVETVADAEAVPAEPVDVEVIRRQAEEETRRKLELEFKAKQASMEERIWKRSQEEAKIQLERDLAAERKKMKEEKAFEAKVATVKAEKAAAAELDKARKEAEEARKNAAQQVKEAVEKATREAAEAQEAKDRQALEQARQAESEARKEAEALAKQMQLTADEDSVRFVILFEQMRDKVEAMQELAKTMREAGKAEQADKYLTALRGALGALRDGMEGA